MITPLRKLYQYHADDCLRVAELAEDPRQRELYLKLASEWIEAAETLGVDAAD